MNAPQTLTPDELSALREAAEKATPAPWCVDSYISKPGDTPDAWHVYEWGEDDPPLATLSWLKPKENAKFIALCRKHILALLGMLAEARETIKDLECQDDIRCLDISVKREERDAALSQLSTTIRERDEAREALRPFAEESIRQNKHRSYRDGDCELADCRLTIGMINRARAILAASDKKDSTDADKEMTLSEAMRIVTTEMADAWEDARPRRKGPYKDDADERQAHAEGDWLAMLEACEAWRHLVGELSTSRVAAERMREAAAKVAHRRADGFHTADCERAHVESDTNAFVCSNRGDCLCLEREEEAEAIENEIRALPLPEGEAAASIAENHEDDMLAVIDQRDWAEECINDIYFMMTGRSPEWSNHFDYAECLEELRGVRQLLGDAARPTPPLPSPPKE